MQETQMIERDRNITIIIIMACETDEKVSKHY